MRFTFPLLLFVPGYWLCIADRGFGGLWALFLSPIAVLIALGIGPFLRRKFCIKSRIHLVDFIGVAAVLAVTYFAIPDIH